MRLIAVIVRDGSILAVDGNFFKRQAASSAGLTDADDDVGSSSSMLCSSSAPFFPKTTGRQRICILAVAIVSGKSFKASYEGLIFRLRTAQNRLSKYFSSDFPLF